MFRLFGQAVGDTPTTIILGEFPWLIEADGAIPSYLQHAWDQQLGNGQIKLILSGSHISAMVKLIVADAPLYRRLTGKLLVEPFTFPEIAAFLKRYSPEKRLADYAMLGGVPDYLLEWQDSKDLKINIQALFLFRWSTLRGEDEVLLSDVLRRNDPDYRTVLASVAQGHRELADIATDANLPSDRTGAPTVGAGQFYVNEAMLQPRGEPSRQLPMISGPQLSAASRSLGGSGCGIGGG